MDKIKEYLSKPLYVAIAAGVLGLIIGLIIAWGIWPVTWYDTDPTMLRMEYKQDYLRMSIQSYIKDQNISFAKQRWEALGDNRQDVMDALSANPGSSITPAEILQFKSAVAGLGTLPNQAGATQVVGATTKAATPAATTTDGGSSILWLVLLCVALLAVGGALAYILVIRKRPGAPLSMPFRQAVEPAEEKYVETERAQVPQGNEPPMTQYMTTYKLGVDLYDDSYSIDSPTGEFLGECGVGIAESIGVGDPKKVTAFEVWLFDKNDIQTVTKVLMSEYAFSDPNISQRLASKGEPVLLEPGKRILLETATLQLEARVVDMNYGQGALPTNSFLDRMTLELAIWPKAK